MDISLEINEDIFFKQGERNVLNSINAIAYLWPCIFTYRMLQ